MGNTGQVIAAFVSMSAWVGNLLSSGAFWIGIPMGVLLSILTWLLVLRRRFRATQVEIGLPFGLGNITYEATDRDRVLAWKMYVQLQTRKAALPFDEDHDVIVNVLDSLHDMFPITRELLSEVNPHHGKSQKSIADFVLRVLNDGIRPYLTRWHATYRRWWDAAIEDPENKNKSMQEIQCAFPKYKKLTIDLKKMNDELAKYAEELLAVVHARSSREKPIQKIEVIPEPPIQEAGAVSTRNAALPVEPAKSESIARDKEIR
ncbi:MAG: hypothetical protein HY360_20930 [Verrucomicrobia bacterium]|nr:hypothetical protein [Verrucomicrobiota bacterium]